MSGHRKPLTGIVAGGGHDDILDLFDATTAADDLGPLPKGTYVALAVKGERTTAKTGTAGYTVEFKVIEGEYAGRRVWMTKYLTPAAMPITKRDLAKLGIDSKDKLAAPFPANRLVCKLTVTVRTLDDGTSGNEVKQIDLLRVQEPEADPFAPQTEGGES